MSQTKICASQTKCTVFEGNITICPSMNINLLFVGGASIFAKFLS